MYMNRRTHNLGLRVIMDIQSMSESIVTRRPGICCTCDTMRPSQVPSRGSPFITRLLASPKYNAVCIWTAILGHIGYPGVSRARVPAAVAPGGGRLRHREKMGYSKRRIFHSRSLQEKESEKKKEKRVFCNLAHSRFLSLSLSLSFSPLSPFPPQNGFHTPLYLVTARL